MSQKVGFFVASFIEVPIIDNLIGAIPCRGVIICRCVPLEKPPGVPAPLVVLAIVPRAIRAREASVAIHAIIASI